jgi:hypothetical protein
MSGAMDGVYWPIGQAWIGIGHPPESLAKVSRLRLIVFSI